MHNDPQIIKCQKMGKPQIYIRTVSNYKTLKKKLKFKEYSPLIFKSKDDIKSKAAKVQNQIVMVL